MIYLDYNATAPYSDKVKDYISNGMINDWGNASSEHDFGYNLSNRIKEDRKIICDFLDCSTGKLFFTSGATESINIVLSQANLSSYGIKTIISSKLEHHATLEPLEFNEKNSFSIKYAENNNQGSIDLNHLENLCQENPNSIVSLLYVNNETGVITDVVEVTKIAHRHNCLVHIDAVQALGKCEFSLDDLDADFVSFSGHKIGAMKGVGLLYINEPKKIHPLIKGGGQEKKVRPGTYNFSSIHSLRLAIEDINFSKNSNLLEMRDEFEKKLYQINPELKINGSDARRVANTSNIYLAGVSSQEVLLNLSREGIYTSTGSACSSGSVEPSHVIQAMGYDKDYARSCLRISIGQSTQKEHLDSLLEKLKIY